MGRQTRFYMLPADEKQFIDFVLSMPNTVIIGTRFKTPEIEVAGIRLWDPKIKKFFICPSTIMLDMNISLNKINTKFYNEEIMDFQETGEVVYCLSDNAPTIEFSKSFMYKDQLRQGRIWCDFYRLQGNEFVYKGDEFKDLYENIVKWIRKNLHKEKGLDGYFGKEAWQWYQSGGVLF